MTKEDIKRMKLKFRKHGWSYSTKKKENRIFITVLPDYSNLITFIDQLVASEVEKAGLSTFTEEEWGLLVDAVAYHSACKECNRNKNQELLEKVAVYQDELQKLRTNLGGEGK